MLAAVLLAACGATEEAAPPEPVREPHGREEPLPVVDTSGMLLPFSFQGLTVVDPGWTRTTPQYADGIYLAAAERDGVLEFSAVDVDGEVRWVAQRPIACSGFDVTVDADGRALAVLTDAATTDDALAATTASAYDLTTGELVWGPVEVPGPYQGPGLVFAAPPEAAMGAGGPRTALDPSTGQVTATEEDADVERVVGEYDGLVLTVEADELVARTTIGGQELWRLAVDEPGWSAEALRASVGSPGEGLALVDTAQDDRALIDLDTGEVVDEPVRDAVVDAMTGTVVVRGDDGMRALGDGDDPLWSQSVSDETTVAAVGGVFLYLRDGGAVRVHNVLTGAVAQAYDPEGEGVVVVPAHITPVGAALLRHDGRLLLATLPDQPLVGEPTPTDGPTSPDGPSGP